VDNEERYLLQKVVCKKANIIGTFTALVKELASGSHLVIRAGMNVAMVKPQRTVIWPVKLIKKYIALCATWQVVTVISVAPRKRYGSAFLHVGFGNHPLRFVRSCQGVYTKPFLIFTNHYVQRFLVSTS